MKTKLLLLTILLTLLAGNVQANDPKKDYYEQRKYMKMFCVIAGIPINQCHRKKK